MPWATMIGKLPMNKNSILLSGLLLSGLAIGLVETDVIQFNTRGIHAQC